MDNLMWGLQMTVLGMGLVFGLLALLWGLLTLVLRLDKPPAEAASALLPAAEAAPEVLPAAESTPPALPALAGPAIVQGMDAELVAAILMATLTHRAVRRGQAAPAMRSYWPGSQLHASRWVGVGRSRQNQSWQKRGQ